MALAASFVPIGVTNRDQRVLLFRLPDPGQKDPLLSRPGGPDWEAGTKRVSQSGQISVSVVVNPPSLTDRGRHAWLNTYMPTTDKIDIVLDTYTLIYTDLYDQVVDEGFIRFAYRVD